MAGVSLLALLDDIAAMMDDVSLMTKVAVRKTAGVLGDDLAVNAEKVSGVRADRELQVVWSVAKGSFRNKLILVPAALLLAAFLPWAINPLLMLGGLFLCYEGFEKVFHAWVHRGESKKALELTPEELADPSFEKNKIQGAIRTDFILSAEIIVISLGTLATAEFSMQVMVLAVIAVVMTIGVYGLVALIVKLDDMGVHLAARQGEGVLLDLLRWTGMRLLDFAPRLMKSLTVIGTIAMFLVGGGILAHGIPWLHLDFARYSAAVANVPVVDWLLPALLPSLFNMLCGMLAGAVTLLFIQGVAKLRSSE